MTTRPLNVLLLFLSLSPFASLPRSELNSRAPPHEIRDANRAGLIYERKISYRSKQLCRPGVALAATHIARRSEVRATLFLRIVVVVVGVGGGGSGGGGGSSSISNCIQFLWNSLLGRVPRQRRAPNSLSLVPSFPVRFISLSFSPFLFFFLSLSLFCLFLSSSLFFSLFQIYFPPLFSPRESFHALRDGMIYEQPLRRTHYSPFF